VAIKTTIVDKISLLETLIAAFWADAALVQPIPVSVHAVLDMVFVNCDAKLVG
jgi:hypothetical protein